MVEAAFALGFVGVIGFIFLVLLSTWWILKGYVWLFKDIIKAFKS